MTLEEEIAEKMYKALKAGLSGTALNVIELMNGRLQGFFKRWLNKYDDACCKDVEDTMRELTGEKKLPDETYANFVARKAKKKCDPKPKFSKKNRMTKSRANSILRELLEK